MSDTPPDVTPHAGKAGILNRKIGGIAVKWLLLLAVVATVAGFGYRYFKNKSAGSVTSSTALPTTSTASADGSPDVNSISGQDFSNVSGGNDVVTSVIGSGITTNAAWVTNAANGIIGQGQYSPTDVENALNSYISGTTLTDTQQSIVNLALSSYGSPPESIIASTSASHPAMNVVTQWHTYVSQPGDTLANVLSRSYSAYPGVTPTVLADFWSINSGGLKSTAGAVLSAASPMTTPLALGQDVLLPTGLSAAETN